MSEKPEALRFGVRRDRETEILRVANTGEFLWHKDADARIANPGPDANPAMMHLFRALRRAEVVQAENERLREALALAERLAAGRLAMVEQLTDEVGALRRDAERYRYLRSRDPKEVFNKSGKAAGVWIDWEDDLSGLQLLTGDDADTAIDAAMKEDKR